MNEPWIFLWNISPCSRAFSHQKNEHWWKLYVTLYRKKDYLKTYRQISGTLCTWNCTSTSWEVLLSSCGTSHILYRTKLLHIFSNFFMYSLGRSIGKCTQSTLIFLLFWEVLFPEERHFLITFTEVPIKVSCMMYFPISYIQAQIQKISVDEC